MKHIVIVTGGYLNIEFAENYLKTLSFDEVFAVDKGLEYIDALGLVPDLLIGDFDTVDRRLLERYERNIWDGELHTQIERHPVMKDASDTELALDIAMKHGADVVTILAGTGNRMDHALANLNLLLKAKQRGVKSYIVDEYNRISLLDANENRVHKIVKKEQHGDYVSLIPLTDRVKGTTIKGALYPLENAILYKESSLTVSNQIVGDWMEIQIMEGQVLIIESRD